jgi:transposase-like protein
MPRPAIPVYPGPDVVRRLYEDEKKSLAEIARLYGVTKTSVSRWLKQAGVSARDVRTATMLSGKYGVQSPEHSEILRRNIALARTKITAEGRTRQREKMLGRTPPNKGRKMSEEQRQKLIVFASDPEYRKRVSERMSGPNSPNWKGGMKSEMDARLDRSDWRRRRIEVYERDNYICQNCSCKCLNSRDSKNHPKRKIQAHHIISRRNGGTDELANLVTLCMSCHQKLERRAA